uniref:Uncharacterized protein n=1 Tax=Panagrolaimus sp. ES5 TaxID=591445 RepID=A0AC34GU01_9BILA
MSTKDYHLLSSDKAYDNGISTSIQNNQFDYLNLNQICKYEQWKKMDETDSSANSSTLSLDIAAYENFVEDSDSNSDDSNGFDMKEGKKNPFEFPRQERNNGLETPEVMRFRASQRLLNPNDSKTNNARQQKIDRLIDAAEEISNSDERQEINTEQFMERLNDRYEELGYCPLQVYKAWCKILGNVKTRFEDNHNGFAKASDERMANIQRKFEPNFCRPGAAARTNAQKIDYSQLYANLQQEPQIEFRHPGEPASEAANVREKHIDTTQPDGQVIETEVFPGNEISSKFSNLENIFQPWPNVAANSAAQFSAEIRNPQTTFCKIVVVFIIFCHIFIL